MRSTASSLESVSTTCELTTSGPLDISVVLRAFDKLRRTLAWQETGRHGIGLGYDVLDISWGRIREIDSQSKVTVTARFITQRCGKYEVDYVATAPNSRCDDMPAAPAVLIRARGWTACPEEPAASGPASGEARP